CTGIFDDGTNFELTATPASGSTFGGWSGAGCSGTGTCAFALGADTTVTAPFTANAEPPPATPPDTEISKAKINAKKGTAKFTFGAAATAKAGSGFQCAL